MITYSFFDDGISEAMFHYVGAHYDEWERANIQAERDLTIAQFCFDRKHDFKDYCEHTFGFSIYLPMEQNNAL